MNKICFIGCGNMASSIVAGLINSGWNTKQILATAKTVDSCEKITKKYAIVATTNNKQAVDKSDIILLCTKPNTIKTIVEEISANLTTKHLLISVAAGITINSITNWAGKKIAVVRSMPNTPATVTTAATGLFANNQVSTEQKQLTTKLFNSIGCTAWVNEENLIDVITALSGSGPAYFFLFIEAMVASATKMGLDESLAINFAKQTALGAAKLAVASKNNLADLRNKVTSPGGTTEQAVKSFNTNKLADIVADAMQSAAKQAKIISAKLDAQ